AALAAASAGDVRCTCHRTSGFLVTSGSSSQRGALRAHVTTVGTTKRTKARPPKTHPAAPIGACASDVEGYGGPVSRSQGAIAGRSVGAGPRSRRGAPAAGSALRTRPGARSSGLARWQAAGMGKGRLMRVSHSRFVLLLLLALACSRSAQPDPEQDQESATQSQPDISEVSLDDTSLPTGRLGFDRVSAGQVVPRVRTVSGVVEVAPGSAAVLSAPTDARITKITVEPGQRVEKGDTLMHIEASAVAVVRAELARSRALSERALQLVTQERQLERLNATSTRDSTLA